jgi:hypothetical protein
LVTSDGRAVISDRVRYSVMGMSVPITATFSGSALVAALTLATGYFSPIYLLFGVLWAFFIFNLDRWIVSAVDFSKPSRRSRLRKLLLAGVRLVIAALIGLSIAEPVLMLIFAPEISVRTASLVDQQIRDAQQEIRDATAQPTSGLGPAYHPFSWLTWDAMVRTPSTRPVAMIVAGLSASTACQATSTAKAASQPRIDPFSGSCSFLPVR